MCVNGMLAGLVAITAPSGWVNPISAVLIGAVAGVLVCLAVPIFDRVKIDDPVGAISVHGVCGLWGLIAVGLFADGTWGGGLNGVPSNVTGLLFGGGAGQLIAQLIGCVTVVAWATGISYAFFKIQHAVMGIRSSEQDELMGLDVPEMGTEAYHGYPGTVLPGHRAPSPAPAGVTPAPSLRPVKETGA
jgi:Amt family ammonium transporter